MLGLILLIQLLASSSGKAAKDGSNTWDHPHGRSEEAPGFRSAPLWPPSPLEEETKEWKICFFFLLHVNMPFILKNISFFKKILKANQIFQILEALSDENRTA